MSTKINVEVVKGIKTLSFMNKEIQSAMTVISPDALNLEYTRIMMGFLLFVNNPHHIAMIGLGGGSLAKFCHKYLTNTYLTVAEISPEVIAARNEFNIPPDDSRLQVYEMDGIELMRQPSLYDVIIVDAFDENGIPGQLTDEVFFEKCFNSLDNDGVLVMNLHINAQAQEIKAACKHIFSDHIFEVIDSEDCNCILFAIKGNLADDVDFTKLVKPAVIDKSAWRQIMPEMKAVLDAYPH